MSDAPERILVDLSEAPYLCAEKFKDHPDDPPSVEYVRADHVNELVAAAYDASASKLDGLHRYVKDHHSKDYRQGHEAALAGGAGVLRSLPPTDATAALAARDARVREAALREAWEKLVCPDPAGKAHSLISYRNGYTQARNDLVALIAKDTTNG